MLCKYDKSGNLLFEKDMNGLLENNSNIASVKVSEDNTYYVAGAVHEPASNDYAFLTKLDKDFNVIFSNTFKADGITGFRDIVVTQNKILVMCNYLHCLQSDDFDKVNIKLSDTDREGGNCFISYDMEGNLLSGELIMKKDTNSADYIEILGILPDGDILTMYYQTWPGFYFYPLTNKKTELPVDSTYIFLYRFSPDMKITYNYKVEGDFLMVNPTILNYALNDDSSFTFQINSKTLDKEKTIVVNFADKYELDKLFRSISDVKEAGYTKESYESFKKVYDDAVVLINRQDAKQSEINDVYSKLKDAYEKLETKSSTGTHLDKGSNFTVIFAAAAILIIAIISVILYKKRMAVK